MHWSVCVYFFSVLNNTAAQTGTALLPARAPGSESECLFILNISSALNAYLPFKQGLVTTYYDSYTSVKLD